jgi:hypothetical protein
MPILSDISFEVFACTTTDIVMKRYFELISESLTEAPDLVAPSLCRMEKLRNKLCKTACAYVKLNNLSNFEGIH